MTRPRGARRPGQIGTGDGGLCETAGMTEMLIGYARVSTGAQDLTVQRNALAGLGVAGAA
jgi:hypothetical protein